MEKDLNLKIEDLGIGENETLILEVREESNGWHFLQEGVESLDKCEHCNRYKQLKYFCLCKKVKKILTFNIYQFFFKI